MARQLTENQQNFLEVLFDQAAGDVVLAKKLSGYSDNTPTRIIVESLKEEIMDATRTYFARTAPKAAFALGNVMNDPTELGIKEKMVAAKDVLDRAEKFGVKPIVVPKKNKCSPVNKPKIMHGGMHKKAEMMGGGMYKGKKHSYAGGGMVKDMKLMRSK